MLVERECHICERRLPYFCSQHIALLPIDYIRASGIQPKPYFDLNSSILCLELVAHIAWMVTIADAGIDSCKSYSVQYSEDCCVAQAFFETLYGTNPAVDGHMDTLWTPCMSFSHSCQGSWPFAASGAILVKFVGSLTRAGA